ncbi:hypothetical protein Zm00014a_044711 [Zea mays]|uniref:Uncharacterized protein n=1 Tax=Zea mays TaxID=4577 RepID=A0A3L6EQ22_MAIZE|nr:hypothetical protein Zm00014a_044711 [Zea mays]
MSQNLKRFHP